MEKGKNILRLLTDSKIKKKEGEKVYFKFFFKKVLDTV